MLWKLNNKPLESKYKVLLIPEANRGSQMEKWKKRVPDTLKITAFICDSIIANTPYSGHMYWRYLI